MTIQHILVPIDFSAYADHALDYAIALAQALQARLTLLHVLDTMSWSVTQEEAMVPPSVWEDMEAGIAEDMEKLRKRVQRAGLQGETLIIHGTPFDTIIDTAKEKGVDLIIMGTHGRTGLTHVLMGSVAERVVHLAPCPVLVTQGNTEKAASQAIA